MIVEVEGRRLRARRGHRDGGARGAERPDASVAFNGEHAIFIGIKATPQGNPLTLVKGVRALFPDLERNLPPSMKMKVAYDSASSSSRRSTRSKKTLSEAVLIVVVVIFLFLASFRSVIIPVVTIPLSLIGVCILMLAAGFSFNLLTLLAMVLAIGLVVDDAIVVVENIHRHLEEGMPPVQASLKGAREIVGPVVSMTITLAAVYAPIGFLGGVTGTLFREFAFTLAGLGDRVRRDRADAVADDVLGVPQERGGGTVRQAGQPRVRRDDALATAASSTARSTTVRSPALFARDDPRPGRLPLHAHSRRNWRRRKTRASCSRSPRRRNTPTSTTSISTATRWTRSSQKFPETDLRFVLNGITGPQGGFAGMLLKPWDERKRSAQTAAAAGAGGAVEDRRRQRVRVQPAAAARRSRRSAGADGDQLDRRLPGRSSTR